jgi:predicted nucleic acid-binding protein
MSVFVDSTTLLYPLDPTELTKGTTCDTWLRAVTNSSTMVLSVQVLNEMHSVVWRRPAFVTARAGIRDHLRQYHRFCTAPPPTPERQEQAWALQDRYRVQWWDALLLASANAAACDYFLSEDLNDGQVYGGVTAINPFRHDPADVLGRALPR